MGSQYICELCNRVNRVNYDPIKHQEQIKLSRNGLVTYSNIHRCKGGFLGINNCDIDANGHIRTITNLQLPTKKKEVDLRIPGLPQIPKNDATKIKTYYIDKIYRGANSKNFRIRIIDLQLRTIIHIGKINPKNEKMIAYITSDLGTIELEYYSSDIVLNSALEKWLSIMVNMLEKLPPTTLGLFIETLNFIYEQIKDYNFPSIFLILQLQTLITAHETHFTLKIAKTEIDEKLAYISAKYGEEVSTIMRNLIAYLVDHPNTPLQFYTSTHSPDLTYLINLFLILEQEAILEIERPGITKENRDIYLASDYI